MAENHVFLDWVTNAVLLHIADLSDMAQRLGHVRSEVTVLTVHRFGNGSEVEH